VRRPVGNQKSASEWLLHVCPINLLSLTAVRSSEGVSKNSFDEYYGLHIFVGDVCILFVVAHNLLLYLVWEV